jgi:hypothetical protein
MACNSSTDPCYSGDGWGFIFRRTELDVLIHERPSIMINVSLLALRNYVWYVPFLKYGTGSFWL